MVNLKRLNITLSNKNPFPGIKPLLYFSCPPSIEQFYIGETHYFNEEAFDDLEDANDNTEIFWQCLERSTRSLTNLSDLTLEEWDGTETKEKFLSIFEQCPRLETMSMKWPYFPAGMDGSEIGKVCPNIHYISYVGAATTDDDGEDFWPIEIMETLPENQVRTLNYHSDSDCYLDEVMAGRTLLRHSRTLRMITFDSTVSSATQRMILGSCEVLEEFSCSRSPINLNDAATASPWASSKMTTLDLKVCISPPASSATQYIPSAGENLTFSQLEIFYRQIGRQTNMEYLNLHLHQEETVDPESMTVSRKVHGPFPGILTLKDNPEGRPGFLDLLAGLSKLQVIGGDIVTGARDGKLAVDAKEVDWILEHWPCLRRESFLPY
ncbi:hypothetical protein BGX24_004816 [Mortierella sp. AD032]|nr:hypothetical protein BGX24_004816 [Mortierella sp. AD032]